MKLVSYSQNHEDILLWRALQHVGTGFYVDVGANDPVDDSVTKLFYDRGWNGINIEPLQEHTAALRLERPRDITLECAVGAEAGELVLYTPDLRGLATASAAVAQLHRDAGMAVAETRVPVRTLSGVFQEHAPANVHFLKIDVEGLEAEVIAGMDFVQWRPWVVVVEATVPNSQTLDISWEPRLLQAQYRAVYFDGLNRFYVAQEHEDLAAAFQAPPNVFDGFVHAQTAWLGEALEAQEAALGETRRALTTAQQDLTAMHTRLVETHNALAAATHELAITSQELAITSQGLAATREQLAQTENALEQERMQKNHLEQALQAILNSHSWRWTAPLRRVMQWAKGET